MQLSIITPVYNEEESLEIFFCNLKKALKNTNFELIFVNDGSSDKSLDIMNKLKEQNKDKIKIISFDKNKGKTKAYSEGFKIAQGKFIATIDSDLQENPSDIPKMLTLLKEGNYDLINGWRHPRNDPFLTKKLPSYMFNLILNTIFKTKVHDSVCGLKLYKKQIAKELKLSGDMHRFIPFIVSKKGYKVAEFRIKHQRRPYGKSKYGLLRVFTTLKDILNMIRWLN